MFEDFVGEEEEDASEFVEAETTKLFKFKLDGALLVVLVVVLIKFSNFETSIEVAAAELTPNFINFDEEVEFSAGVVIVAAADDVVGAAVEFDEEIMLLLLLLLVKNDKTLRSPEIFLVEDDESSSLCAAPLIAFPSPPNAI